MKILIDTDPCATCDFAQCLCGRDVEDCMRDERNKADYDAGFEDFKKQLRFEANEAWKESEPMPWDKQGGKRHA